MQNLVRPTLVAMATTFALGSESNRLPACMSVCLFVTLLQFDSSSLFLDGIEPFLGHQFSMTQTTKRCSSILARDSMLSALYAIARPSVRPSVRLSVRLSVRHTGGSVENG